MNKYDFYDNSEHDTDIICPYCGKHYEPIYEETYIGDEYIDCYEEGESIHFCAECGKKFKLNIQVEYMYETETADDVTYEEAEEKGWW